MVVCLAESQTFSLIMPVSQERFFTLCTNKVFYMPMLAQSSNHTLLYWPPARPADRDAHFVVTSETVELVQLVGRVAGPGADLARAARQLFAASCAVEVVRMVDLATEPERLPVDGAVAHLAHVLAQAVRLHLLVAFMAQSTTLVFNKPEVSQLLVAHFTREAFRVPCGLHCLDDSTNDKLATFLTAGSKQHMEVVFTILATLVLVEHALGKRPKALGAHEAVRVEQLAVRVDNLRLGLEPVVAAGTRHRVHAAAVQTAMAVAAAVKCSRSGTC